MAYFTNSSATDNFTQPGPVPNPYHFSVAAALNEQVGRITDGPNENDPEFTITTHSALVLALFYNATIYNLKYCAFQKFVESLARPSNCCAAPLNCGVETDSMNSASNSCSEGSVL
jgi:hypothetical protein